MSVEEIDVGSRREAAQGEVPDEARGGGGRVDQRLPDHQCEGARADGEPHRSEPSSLSLTREVLKSLRASLAGKS